MTLHAIIGCISRAYDVPVKALRDPSRTRVFAKAGRTIGWLARYFEASTIQDGTRLFSLRYFHLQSAD